ncbi:hypothetical protein [Sulfuricurvum sp.]|uniref:hypothetical protein n=1 Tax=Sulfuricurvum sp. TaxID=2025608 RepID=UPI0019AAF4BE|nr:hypothetical protein [Sulfuricurvum sp.]MBD3798907.1 hypothetical protein [Campylobacterota bacterium]MBD3805738.1 hypothetical protein [Sulfuricurvum sp.]
MIKALQAFLTGLFFTFLFDFSLFLGLKLHYIDAHGIKLFFNPFFADNQNVIVLLALTIFIGWITMYQRSIKTAIIVLSLFALISASALIPQIGSKFGDALFRKGNQQITIAPHTYRGDILYIDRQKLYFFDTDLQRLITLPKEKK